MERLEPLLRALREQEPQEVRVADVRTHPKYQPRDPATVRPGDRSRLETSSDEHIARLRGHLAAGEGQQLDPLLVAEVEGEGFVIDGHHRLRAYQLAKREHVKVRILKLSENDAVMLAKLVNLDGTKLPLHAEQAREAAWQYLALATMRGRLPRPVGMSCRSVAARFGLKSGHDTVNRMIRKLPEVNLEHYGEAACDPGTGWPRWSAVKGNAFRDAFGDTPLDIREQQQAEKLASAFLGKLDKASLSVRRRVAEVIRRDAAQAQDEALADALDEWSGRPTDY